MLDIDLRARTFHPLVEAHWKTHCLPDMVGIVAGNGRMLALDEQAFDEGAGRRLTVRAGALSTVDAQDVARHGYSEVIPYVQRAPIGATGAWAICGEGIMGNEGFVAVLNPHGLVWAMCSGLSNPFCDIAVAGDCVEARSTHDIVWRFPATRPWEIGFTYLDWRR